jgi:holo-[acyl-carrier protein] synthase
MALHVGIDLVSVETVRDAVRDHADRYLTRIYTGAELEDCTNAQGLILERLAARFAAKEAAVKVLRPSDEAIPWQTIRVVRDPAGWVSLELTGRAAKIAEEKGLGGFALSIAHETEYATAVVIAEQSLRN